MYYYLRNLGRCNNNLCKKVVKNQKYTLQTVFIHCIIKKMFYWMAEESVKYLNKGWDI